MKTPWHIRLIGAFAVLFNAIGVFDFVLSMAQGAKYQASAGMTPDQIAHYQGMPGWMTFVWAVGVFGAFLGDHERRHCRAAGFLLLVLVVHDRAGRASLTRGCRTRFDELDKVVEELKRQEDVRVGGSYRFELGREYSKPMAFFGSLSPAANSRRCGSSPFRNTGSREAAVPTGYVLPSSPGEIW